MTNSTPLAADPARDRTTTQMTDPKTMPARLRVELARLRRLEAAAPAKTATASPQIAMAAAISADAPTRSGAAAGSDRRMQAPGRASREKRRDVDVSRDAPRHAGAAIGEPIEIDIDP